MCDPTLLGEWEMMAVFDLKTYHFHCSFEIKGLTMPMPNHGHVLLVDPSPVLMYQIGSNETRVLIDVPGKLPSIANGDLKRYFEESIAPQLPESIRVSTTCFIAYCK